MPGDGGAIRPAGACDVALLAELYGRCFADGEGFSGTPWSARSLAEVLALPGVFALLAVQAGPAEEQPAGFLLAQVLFEEAELLTVGVLPSCRRRGHARRLLQAAVTESAQRGAHRMQLEVVESNARAQALYRAAGFAPFGRRRNYYRQADGTALDAVLYVRPLAPAAL
ncbi:GNAT family N-acetyltransferase [Pelagibius sp. 7325]|uniref:GNAT family N-acetyltransferase n=1 Tax=Pelagibius sp. 7325 TaxID=3131994 RepID=UPI0030EC55C8